ncbi:MAG: uracil-xanthine permease family protein [Acidimicrobiia bacterium]|nr:uracil-xanthine permease family protein [Acidimicrobiia bacterium]
MELTLQKKVVLGLQHTMAMFGATILVPIITGLDIGVTLLAAGFGTLLFHLVTKQMVPVFLGSSFAFIPPILSATSEGYSWEGIGAGIIGAAVIYIAMSILITFVGTDVVRRIFPPVVTGPIIMVIGVTLAAVAIASARTNWWLAIVSLLATIIAAIYFKGLFKMLPILTGFVVGYLVAIATGNVEFEAVTNAKWIGLPEFTFGLGNIEWGAIVLIAPVAFVTMIEHVGDILANGRVVGRDFFKEPGLNRTLLGDGIATMFAGLIGGPPNTTYSENTGVLAVTRVYDPFIIRIGAVFAIALGLIPKLSALLTTVPSSVLGGLEIILFGMIAAVGLRTLVEGEVDFKRSRNMIVAGVIAVFGLGIGAFEQVNTLVGGIEGYTNIVRIGDVTVSGLALAAVAGVAANLILPMDTEEVEVAMPSETKSST